MSERKPIPIAALERLFHWADQGSILRWVLIGVLWGSLVAVVAIMLAIMLGVVH